MILPSYMYALNCRIFAMSYIDCATRRLQDHERVKGDDVVVATDVSGGERREVARGGTAGCDYKRDRGVCGCDLVVAVEVTSYWSCCGVNGLPKF